MKTVAIPVMPEGHSLMAAVMAAAMAAVAAVAAVNRKQHTVRFAINQQLATAVAAGLGHF
jgi:hypothetical protein